MSKDRTADGTIRKLFANEADKFRDHLLRLDKESRRLRFAHGVSDAFIEDYASRMSEMGSIVYGYIVDGEVRAAAELRKLSDTWGHEAEAAFSATLSRSGKRRLHRRIPPAPRRYSIRAPTLSSGRARARNSAGRCAFSRMLSMPTIGGSLAFSQATI